MSGAVDVTDWFSMKENWEKSSIGCEKARSIAEMEGSKYVKTDDL